jgi:hypothetical protein
MSIKEISCENARFRKRSICKFLEHSTELSVCIKAGNYCSIRGCPGGDYEDYCLLERETVEIINVSAESTVSTFRVLVKGRVL